MRPLRVLHVLGKLDRAGIETWLMHVLRRLDRREIAIDFLVQAPEPGAYDEEARSLGASILPCPNPHQPWRYAWNFRRLLRQYPYDIVHSHTYFFSGFDLRLAAGMGVGARIAHIHPYSDIKAGQPLRGAYRRLMGRWIASYATCMLAPSEASLEVFRRWGDWRDKKRAIVRNCVDAAPYEGAFDRNAARRRLGIPEDRPVAVYVARFAPHKNHGLVLRVAERLNAAGTRYHFVLAGTDGETRRGVQARIAGRADFSLFVGAPEIAPLLRCADLFLFPSLEEGFGTVAIEAAAAGLPVVASDLPAIREACAPGHRDYMFPPGDEEAAASRVALILGSEALRRRLGDEARRWAEGFSVEASVESLRQVYAACGAQLRGEIARGTSERLSRQI